METIWIVVILALLIIGLLGTFIPVLPSTAIGWIAMLIFYLVSENSLSGSTMIWVTVAAVVVQLLDVLLPLWGVKLFGGTKKGVRGATIGLIVAAVWSFTPLTFLFPGFLAIIIFPIIGAFTTEIVAEDGNLSKAFGGAMGSLLGFFLTVGFKFALIVWYLYLVVDYLVFYLGN